MLAFSISITIGANEQLGGDSAVTRAEQLRTLSPQLVADVTMYPASEGGRRATAYAGWGCPCSASKAEPIQGYDGYPLLGETTLEPGQRRRLGFVFMIGEEAAKIMRAAGTFYLWEGGFIGEAVVDQTGVVDTEELE